MRPFTLTMPDGRYWRAGAELAQAWSVGEDYQPRGPQPD